jgi:hypothetical protein
MKASVLSLVRTLQTETLVEILFKMAQSHPDSFEGHILQHAPERVIPVKVPFSDRVVQFSNIEFSELKGFGVRADKKVTGIKRIREITNLGLKEAKDLYEETFEDRTAQNRYVDSFGT